VSPIPQCVSNDTMRALDRLYAQPRTDTHSHPHLNDTMELGLRNPPHGVYTMQPIHMDVFALAQCDISTVGHRKVREHHPARSPIPRHHTASMTGEIPV